ncbi:unnamed protein product [Fusarium graminearum]|nr:unnamed protein product [Fusarium graminearum]
MHLGCSLPRSRHARRSRLSVCDTKRAEIATFTMSEPVSRSKARRPSTMILGSSPQQKAMAQSECHLDKPPTMKHSDPSQVCNGPAMNVPCYKSLYNSD